LNYQVKWSDNALFAMRKLPRGISLRIVRKLTVAKENPFHFLERLQNDQCYKLRVGNYRIIIDILGSELFVRSLGHRRDIYKRK